MKISKRASSALSPLSTEPLSSSAPILKTDGSLRVCYDYRDLNANTIKDKTPLSLLSEGVRPHQLRQDLIQIRPSRCLQPAPHYPYERSPAFWLLYEPCDRLSQSHSQSDVQTERTNQTIDHIMRCFCDYRNAIQSTPTQKAHPMTPSSSNPTW